jgi:hypothetical protein
MARTAAAVVQQLRVASSAALVCAATGSQQGPTNGDILVPGVQIDAAQKATEVKQRRRR